MGHLKRRKKKNTVNQAERHLRRGETNNARIQAFSGKCGGGHSSSAVREGEVGLLGI